MMKYFYGLLILLIGLAISGVSAYYSIAGLTAIFAAAFWPIVVMGGALELGKISAMVWLHTNWKKSPLHYKLYLVPAAAILMLITSMGTFGYLSKAHIDQTAGVGDVSDQVVTLDDRIKSQRENITADRQALSQMDSQVNELLARTKTQEDTKGAERAVQLRRQQTAERTKLNNEIKTAQSEIERLQNEKAPLAAKARKVDAEVGPIKYIAAFIYSDQPDQGMLEKAVRWVIVLIVSVFDPLALVLILSATLTLEEASEERKKGKPISPEHQKALDDLALASSQAEERLQLLTAKEKEYADTLAQMTADHSSTVDSLQTSLTETEAQKTKKHEDLQAVRVQLRELNEEHTELQKLKKTDDREHNRALAALTKEHEQKQAEVIKLQGAYDVLKIQVTALQTEKVELDAQVLDLANKVVEAEDKAKSFEATNNTLINSLNTEVQTSRELTATVEDLQSKLSEAQLQVTMLSGSADVAKFAALQADYALLKQQYDDQVRSVHLLAEEIRSLRVATMDSQTHANVIEDRSALDKNVVFGPTLPDSGNAGDMFLLTSVKPSVLYKWNGEKWISVDKNLTDSYAFNDAYIDFLIEKLTSGEYSIDDLNAVEHDLITKKLQGK